MLNEYRHFVLNMHYLITKLLGLRSPLVTLLVGEKLCPKNKNLLGSVEDMERFDYTIIILIFD